MPVAGMTDGGEENAEKNNETNRIVVVACACSGGCDHVQLFNG
jgi:hypothetical protein